MRPAGSLVSDVAMKISRGSEDKSGGRTIETLGEIRSWSGRRDSYARASISPGLSGTRDTSGVGSADVGDSCVGAGTMSGP